MTDLGRNELEPAGLAVVLLLDELEHLRVDLGQRLGLLDAALVRAVRLYRRRF